MKNRSYAAILRNNLVAMLIHLCLTVIIGIIYIRTAQYCVDYTEARFWVHLGLILLTVVLYIAAGAILLKDLGKAWRNFISLLLPIIAGLIIYAADVHFASYYVTGYKTIIYPAYIMLFTPVLEVVSSFMNYRHMWFLLAALPTLLIWAGMQIRASSANRRRRKDAQYPLPGQAR